MAELREWDTAAANNNNAPPNGFPENMNYSEVNNAAREVMAVLARYERDTRGTLAAGGTGNAITVTPVGTYAAYFAGMQIGFTALATNTGATTINVGAVGAVAIVDQDGQALEGGEIVAGGIYQVVHDGTQFRLRTTSTPQTLTGTTLNLSATTAVDLTDANAVLVVSPGTGQHLELDGDEIQSKSNATTAATLNINRLGGAVAIAAGGGQVDIGSIARSEAQGLQISTTTTNPAVKLYDANYVEEQARFSFSEASNLLLVRAEVNSAHIQLRSPDAGGTARVMIEADPDGTITLGNNGLAAAQNVIIDAATGQDAVIQIAENSVQQFRIFHDASANQLKLRAINAGDSFRFEEGNGVHVSAELTPNAGVVLRHDNNIRFSTVTNGVLVQGISANVMDLQRTDNTINAHIQYRGSSGDSVYAGMSDPGHFAVGTGIDLTATANKLFEVTDTGITLYHTPGDDVLTTRTGGVIISGDATNANPIVEFDNASGTRIGFIIVNDAGNLQIENENHGQAVIISGEDAGGTSRNLFQGDPDNATILYNAGNAAITTSTGPATTALGVQLGSSPNAFIGYNSADTAVIIAGPDKVQVFIDANDNSTGTQFSIFRDAADEDDAAAQEIFRVDEQDTILYFDAVEQLRTLDADAANNTTGAEIRHHDGSFYDLGMNQTPVLGSAAAITLTDEHVGKLIRKTASNDVDLTTTSNNAPNGSMWMVWNDSGGNVTIDATGVTLTWLDAGSGATGDRTLADNSICTILKRSTGQYLIWGNGLT